MRFLNAPILQGLSVPQAGETLVCISDTSVGPTTKRPDLPVTRQTLLENPPWVEIILGLQALLRNCLVPFQPLPDVPIVMRLALPALPIYEIRLSAPPRAVSTADMTKDSIST
eukprot:scaffold626_cov409-Prasinococcus_capsulatus_cf.AAC.21